MEFKSLPMFTKSIEDRTVTGIMAVHGNMDESGDISHPGSFARTIAHGNKRWRFLWNHNTDMFAGPPIAVIKSLEEIGRDQLPQEVLNFAPDATGGVQISREYLDTPRGEEVFKNVLAGGVDEMSYGYDPVQFDFTEVNGARARNLREIRFWEGSDVLWGMNPATLGSKGLLPEIEVLLKQMEQALVELKAGARHSANDTKLLNAIHKMAVDLGATACKGIADEGDGSNDGEKARPDAPNGLSLTFLKSKLDVFELETLRT